MYHYSYTVNNKSDATLVFKQFQSLVKNYFSTSIRSVYIDGNGKATRLGHFLSQVGVQHLKFLPHTPEHVCTIERKHRNVVETVVTLLHHASIPLKY